MTVTYPTAQEMEIYKSPYKLFDVRAAVRLDYPLFVSPFHDHFLGSALDRTLWDVKLPTWGVCTISGSTCRLSTTGEAISPSWIVSKPNLAFPKNKTTDWVLEIRIRFPVVTGFGVFFRVGTLEYEEAAFAVKANEAGLEVKLPDSSIGGEHDIWVTGDPTPWRRYRMVFDASEHMYSVYIDADDDGIYELGPFNYDATGLQADYIVIGNSTARQGSVGAWTEIETDYITITGTSESYDLPVWAGPMYLYDSIGYDQELWAYLPTVLRGDISISFENATDSLSLDLLNFNHGYNERDPMWRLYTDFSFSGRPVKVLSRVSDGRSWTRWRQIYLGSCDEKNTELRDNGDCVLTVSARDIYRRHLDTVHLVRGYADIDPAIDGMGCGMIVSEIVQDISQYVCGLPDRAIDIICTPYNKPKTFNLSGESGAEAISRLLSETALCWKVNHATGQILIDDWPWGTDTPGYRLSTQEEILNVSWRESAMDFINILEMNIENTEFHGGGFSTNYPLAPVPFYGRTDFRSTLTAQTTGDLYGRPLHYLLWKIANRKVRSLSLGMQCQDWLELGQEVAVRDDKYLGIKEKHGPWIVDGYSYRWEGSESFEVQVDLANQHPDRIIRESIHGSY
jgi:hypothetical protein